MRFILLAAAAACLSAPAVAGDPMPVSEPAPQAEPRDIVIDLGVGAKLEPKFPSADKYIFSPWPIAELKFLRLPVFGEVVTGRTRVVTVYPAFNFIGARDDSDADYLAGTGDVDFAVELGGGVRVQRGPFRAFAEVRAGLTGHSGLVAEFGADFVARQHDRFEVSIGPRIAVASDDYMDTYFAVRPGAAVLPAYDPDAGITEVGIALDANYALTERVRLHGYAAYDRFVGDAADSPIVQAGNEDAFSFGLGITYRFGADLY